MPAVPHAVDLSVKPIVTAFFDEPTNTVSYVVQDPNSKSCAVIDSVMGRLTVPQWMVVVGWLAVLVMALATIGFFVL